MPDGKLPKYWWRSLHCKCRKKDEPERSAAAMFVCFGAKTESNYIHWNHSGAHLRAPLLWRSLTCLFYRRQRSLCAGSKIFFCVFFLAPCTVSALSQHFYYRLLAYVEYNAEKESFTAMLNASLLAPKIFLFTWYGTSNLPVVVFVRSNQPWDLDCNYGYCYGRTTLWRNGLQ